MPVERAASQEAPGVDSRFSAEPDSVAQARGLVTRWLRGEIPDEDILIGDIAVAVSEACTNVVVHAYLGQDDQGFRVIAHHDDGTVRITVSDQGNGMAPRPDSPGVGLGLPLITTLAERVDITPAPDGRGTVVAMHFRRNGN